jgi:hypothetical protein
MYWTEPRNLRDSLARNPLVVSFAISLIVHALLFGGWRMGKRLGWWDHQATWLLQLTKKMQALRPRPPVVQRPPEQQFREIPLSFMEVDPALMTPAPPKDAKFYGAQNSVAANPEPEKKPDPKVDGTQKNIVRAETVPKPKPFPLQPAIEPPKPAQDARPKTEPAGDLAKVEVKNPVIGEQQPEVHERPRRLAQVQPERMLAGEKVRQEGGAASRGRVSFDVKATPFGAYDAKFIAAVQQRWYDLLDSSRFSQRSGKVVLEFRLMYDGRITDMKVDGNDVGDLLGLLCQRAILDPAPFDPWPGDMRRMIGQNFREVTFTFYYN